MTQGFHEQLATKVFSRRNQSDIVEFINTNGTLKRRKTRLLNIALIDGDTELKNLAMKWFCEVSSPWHSKHLLIKDIYALLDFFVLLINKCWNNRNQRLRKKTNCDLIANTKQFYLIFLLFSHKFLFIHFFINLESSKRQVRYYTINVFCSFSSNLETIFMMFNALSTTIWALYVWVYKSIERP